MRERIVRAIAAEQKRRLSTRRSPEDKGLLGPDDPGTIEKEYIRQGVRDIVPLVRECYEEALRGTPELEGKLVVRFTITGEPDIGGIIADSQIVEGSTIEDASFRECVQETMYAILMRAPDRGGRVVVTYPFVFKVAEP